MARESTPEEFDELEAVIKRLPVELVRRRRLLREAFARGDRSAVLRLQGEEEHASERAPETRLDLVRVAWLGSDE